MAKPLFQDIVPPDRKSIRNIEVPSRKRSMPIRSDEPEDDFLPPPPPRPRRKTQRSGPHVGRIIFTLLAVAIILGAGFWFVSRVSGAQIILTPHQQDVTVDGTFTALKDKADATLQFQTVTIAKDGTLQVPATGEEYANTKASGVIVIYNKTSAPQKLVANTRFQSPQGKIFRISQAITIPAKSGSTPGSIDAAITADAVGPDYNVGLTDFTIPGFKGDPKYTDIYARSKTAIDGGFNGMRKKVDAAALKAAHEKIEGELKATLVQEAAKDIPSGYVLPNNAYFIEYEPLPDSQKSNGVEIGERATFHGFIFLRTDLAREILKKGASDATAESDFTNIDSLAFTLNSATSSKPWEEPTINFSLKGTTTIMSVIDTDKLKTELVGKPRKSLNAVLAGYPGVAKAQVTMRPFWKSSFPDVKDEISIIVTKP